MGAVYKTETNTWTDKQLTAYEWYFRKAQEK